MKILVINGPNLNMLGIREPDIYGRQTYSDLEKYLKSVCAEKNIECEVFQSNHEGDLIDELQRVGFSAAGIVLNAAAYTHTSIAIADTLRAI
ncbi:MAG: 3-dehydroquinate dehydratase, partial [Spirochaetaceae bacterium]|nr:3-dehydroquinate dehydratase [Spirochaetaceae bacterium]